LNNSQNLSALLLAKRNSKSFLIHMDNPPIHIPESVQAKISGMPVQLAPHPPYSPDLAPSDFFVFGHLKSMMAGREFDSPQNLIAWIKATFERISRSLIERVFEEWMDQMEQCIAHQGSYFSED
jgi:transposase